MNQLDAARVWFKRAIVIGGKKRKEKIKQMALEDADLAVVFRRLLVLNGADALGLLLDCLAGRVHGGSVARIGFRVDASELADVLTLLNRTIFEPVG